MSESLDDKYIVFKRWDFDEIYGNSGATTMSTMDRLQELQLTDTFVLRAQDLFAVAALYGYAHLIQTALELDNVKDFFDSGERARLSSMADEINELAAQWARTTGKVPD